MNQTYTFVEYGFKQMRGIDCIATIFLGERIRNVFDIAHRFDILEVIYSLNYKGIFANISKNEILFVSLAFFLIFLKDNVKKQNFLGLEQPVCGIKLIK